MASAVALTLGGSGDISNGMACLVTKGVTEGARLVRDVMEAGVAAAPFPALASLRRAFCSQMQKGDARE